MTRQKLFPFYKAKKLFHCWGITVRSISILTKYLHIFPTPFYFILFFVPYCITNVQDVYTCMYMLYTRVCLIFIY